MCIGRASIFRSIGATHHVIKQHKHLILKLIFLTYVHTDNDYVLHSCRLTIDLYIQYEGPDNVRGYQYCLVVLCTNQWMWTFSQMVTISIHPHYPSQIQQSKFLKLKTLLKLPKDLSLKKIAVLSNLYWSGWSIIKDIHLMFLIFVFSCYLAIENESYHKLKEKEVSYRQ